VTMVKDNKDDAFLLLQDAAHAQSLVAIKAIDKLAGYGIDADWTIDSAKESQDKDGNDAVDFEFSLCTQYRDETWIVAAGT